LTLGVLRFSRRASARRPLGVKAGPRSAPVQVCPEPFQIPHQVSKVSSL